jgi:hypothetical protein
LNIICKLKPKEGYVTLISVLIVSAVGLAIAISVLLLGINSTKTSLVIEQSDEARVLANTCVDEALERIRRNSAYTGTVTLNLGNGSCSYIVQDTGGTSRQIDSTGTIGTIVRKVQVILDQVSPMNVVTWQDVADF